MSFTTSYLGDPANAQEGEIYGIGHTILAAPNFEDGLLAGRFAKIASDILENMDGSVTPVIAGVVKRRVANAVEDADAFDNTLFGDSQQYVRSGLVSVKALTGESPVKFAAITASNAGDTHDGKASVVAADVDHIATNAEFIEVSDASTDVWMIRLV